MNGIKRVNGSIGSRTRSGRNNLVAPGTRPLHHNGAASYADLIAAFPQKTIMVLGDLVADVFVFGEISRISREAPVLIIKHRETTIVPGGGANAANNLAALGARVIPVGVAGDDPAGQALIEYFREKGLETGGILVAPEYSTTTKTRILAGTVHGQRQQVVRIDREPAEHVSDARRREVERRALRFLKRSDAVLISDYGYGASSPELAAAVRSAANGRPVTIDSRYDLLQYRGGTAATPNEAEVEAACGTAIGNDTRKLEQAGRGLLRKLALEALLVTRGRHGMALFEPARPTVHIPISGSAEVADVTGAGDTVIAVFTLALAAGASFEQAARLSNFAGGIVVMKRGTATVSAAELSAVSALATPAEIPAGGGTP